MGQIDITPSKIAYMKMLKIIIKKSENSQDVEWAKKELIRVFQVKPTERLYLSLE